MLDRLLYFVLGYFSWQLSMMSDMHTQHKRVSSPLHSMGVTVSALATKQTPSTHFSHACGRLHGNHPNGCLTQFATTQLRCGNQPNILISATSQSCHKCGTRLTLAVAKCGSQPNTPLVWHPGIHPMALPRRSLVLKLPFCLLFSCSIFLIAFSFFFLFNTLIFFKFMNIFKNSGI